MKSRPNCVDLHASDLQRAGNTGSSAPRGGCLVDEAATRRAFLGLSLLAVAGAVAGPTSMAVGAARRGRREGAQPGRQGQGLQWTELRDGVWASIGGGGNSMLAIGGEEAALVDTKLASLGATLQREATSRAPKLAMVINTHHHADHSGGNFAFEDPRLVAHAKAAPRIRGQGDKYLEQIRSALSGAGLSAEMQGDLERVRAQVDDLDADSWAPCETVEGDSAEWTIGEDLEIHARHFGPGHTDNDMAIYLPQRNVLHAGDLLFHQMHPYFDPSGGVTCEGWIKSVKGAIGLCDEETIVIPGHGAITDIDGLKAQLRYLEKLWEEVGELVDDGWTRDRATTMQWPFMDELGRPELRARAIAAVFDERSGE